MLDDLTLALTGLNLIGLGYLIWREKRMDGNMECMHDTMHNLEDFANFVAEAVLGSPPGGCGNPDCDDPDCGMNWQCEWCDAKFASFDEAAHHEEACWKRWEMQGTPTAKAAEEE